MWNYDRKLQYPVNIKNPDAKAAKIIISQYGGLNLNKILYKNLNDRYGNQIYKMKKARRLKLVGKLFLLLFLFIFHNKQQIFNRHTKRLTKSISQRY